MDVESLFRQHSDKLIPTLEQAGLSRESAESFLPEAAQEISRVVSAQDVMAILQGADVRSKALEIAERVDCNALATKLGIDNSVVKSGISTVVPKAIDLLQGEGLGGALGAVGKLFG